MQNLEHNTAVINGKIIDNLNEIKINHNSFEINLHGRETISLYTFNSLMLPSSAKREGVELYKFSGPRLGLYHDTADVREGPYVNHFIESLEIEISYPSSNEAQFRVKGHCHLANSSFDTYWYKGGTSGIWEFEVCFTHRFDR